MKGFSAIPSRTVTLTHGEQSVDLVLRPAPIGYVETIEARMPIPQPPPLRKEPDPADLTRWAQRRRYLLLGYALADQLSATPPGPSAGAAAWEAYADSIAAEFVEAKYLEGDIVALSNAFTELQRGIGDLPKV
jgi:hypothetical protein